MNGSVQAMLRGGPTAALRDYRTELEQDGNLWWRTDCGHHLNLFEEACDEVDRLTLENRALDQIAAVLAHRAGDPDAANLLAIQIISTILDEVGR